MASHFYLKGKIIERLDELQKEHKNIIIEEIRNKQDIEWEFLEGRIKGNINTSEIAQEVFSFIEKGTKTLILNKKGKLIGDYLEKQTVKQYYDEHF